MNFKVHEMTSGLCPLKENLDPTQILSQELFRRAVGLDIPSEEVASKWAFGTKL